MLTMKKINLKKEKLFKLLNVIQYQKKKNGKLLKNDTGSNRT